MVQKGTGTSTGFDTDGDGDVTKTRWADERPTKMKDNQVLRKWTHSDTRFGST
jgi:hypothetical protein